MIKKGFSLVMAIMIAMIIMISLSGVIGIISFQRQAVFGNIADTQLAFMAEGGLDCGLKWFGEHIRGDLKDPNFKQFPATGTDPFKVNIDGVIVEVAGKKQDNSSWTFIATAARNGRSCTATATNVLPAQVNTSGSGLEMSGINPNDQESNRINGTRVDIGSHDYKLSETGQLTVMCWVKWNSESNEYQWSNIVSNADDNGHDIFRLQHDSQNDYIEFALNSNNNKRVFAMGAKKLEKDKWYHIAATYDNREMKVYINGDYQRWNMRYSPFLKKGNDTYRAYDIIHGKDNPKKSNEYNQSAADKDVAAYEAGLIDFKGNGIKKHSSSYKTMIGASAGVNTSARNEGMRNFKGRIDDVSIWNRALSEDEIRNYRTGSSNIQGSEGNLQAFWDFEELGQGGSNLANGTKIINKKMITQNDKLVRDNALDGTLVCPAGSTVVYKGNTNEHRDDDSDLKQIGALSMTWSISHNNCK